VILGNAGQRVITAGELLCLAGMSAGLNVSQKNEYNITVLRGHSISEVILSPENIGYTGIESPSVVLAISQEGIDRRKTMFSQLDDTAIVISAKDTIIPDTKATIHVSDFKANSVRSQDVALASLGVLAGLEMGISVDMLETALTLKFKGAILENALEIVRRMR
jgi:Pyruvate/2-oxoacid:ferredoxin oxidoreductase gamma subunit